MAAHAEGLDMGKLTIEEWAKHAEGDVRNALTALQFGTVRGK